MINIDALLHNADWPKPHMRAVHALAEFRALWPDKTGYDDHGRDPNQGGGFPSNLTKVSGAKGSNPGGVYKDEAGQKWYVKNYKDADQAAGEHAANAVYARIGIDSADSRISDDGKTIALKWKDGQILNQHGLDKETADRVLDGFAGDVFLQNWDAVGTGHDNVLVKPDGSVMRIDQGGTLLHRAQGSPKPEAGRHDIGEWESLRSVNPYYAQVFKRAGVASGDALGERAAKQIDKIVAGRPKTGWESLIRQVAPKASEDYKRRAGAMLEARQEKLEAKRDQLRKRGAAEFRALWPDKTGHDDHGRGPSSISHFVPATAQQRKDLKLPPAWTDVRVNPDKDGDVVAVGTDKKGRVQRRYSAAHSEAAAAEKFERLKAFHGTVRGLRKQVESDLSSDDPKVREAATLVRLIDRTSFRIGSNRDTMADKKAYGATTLEGRHVKIDGNRVSFDFVGKKGVDISKTVEDAKLAKALQPYVKKGPLFSRGADTNVRNYLDEHAPGFTPKDFRTYRGTSKALEVMKNMTIPSDLTAAQRLKLKKQIAKEVAAHLGNTAAVSLKSYIDPAVFGRLGTP